MKDDMTLDEIKAIDEMYHEVVFANQGRKSCLSYMS